MLNLTRQERQVFLFLISLGLAGLGINFLSKEYSAVKTLICFNQDIAKADLNKADLDTLISITGIGEKLARRIIEYRKQNGDFKGLDELLKIKGINSYRYEKIKGLLCVK